MKKKNLKNILSLFLFIGLLIGIKSPVVLAQYGYGEIPPTVEIVIDKKILNPEKDKGDSEEYVDNLGPTKYHFSPGEEVNFKIRIENTGEKTFEKVKVKDILPEYVDFISGSTEVEYENVEPDESREFGLKVKVVSADKLPNDQGLYCVINKAEVEADDQKDDDTAQFCIEKKVLGVEVQPEAGVNLLLLGSGFLGLAFLGLLAEKKKILTRVSQGH
jgi:uncharacterized repeat protein (TIGR01451 family)